MKKEQIRKGYGILCCIIGILLNIFLFAGKYFAGVVSGSVAITADAFNNLLDAGSSMISFIGFWFAGKKPDIEHPFGHGRFEYLSGLGVSFLIILMGFELAKDSVGKIINHQTIQTQTVTLCILVISIAVKLYMAFYNAAIGSRIHSSAMKATAVDSISDAAATTVVFVSVLIYKYADINIDGICGLLVSLFILYAGYNVAKETVSPLLGQPPEQEFVDAVNEIVLAHEGICAVHDLVVHDYGPGRVMITLHAEVPGDRNIFSTHALIDRIENELNEKLGCEAVIHMDPVDINNRETEEAKRRVEQILSEINSHITVHDFRVQYEEGETKLLFDILVPYAEKAEDEDIRQIVTQKIIENDIASSAVIHVDRDYTKQVKK